MPGSLSRSPPAASRLQSPICLQERSVAAAATHLRSSWVALLARHLSVLTQPLALPEPEKLLEAAPGPSPGPPQPTQLQAAAAAAPAAAVRQEGGAGGGMATALPGEVPHVLAGECWALGDGAHACTWGCCG